MTQEEKEYLDNYDISQYARPSLASDIILLALQRDKPGSNIKNLNVHGLQILLIKRASHPFKDKWALPGGFCRPTESVYETAKRELMEETNVANAYLKIDDIHSDQNRDPRGWIISVSWLGMIDKYACSLRADSDAWEAAWFTIKDWHSHISKSCANYTEYTHVITIENENTHEMLVSIITETVTLVNQKVEHSFKVHQSSLAFDHDKIIMESLIHLRDSIKEDIRPIFNLFPKQFTIGELQTAYEIIIGHPTNNFRRKISDYVIETNTYADIKGYRPAKLFTINQKKFTE